MAIVIENTDGFNFQTIFAEIVTNRTKLNFEGKITTIALSDLAEKLVGEMTIIN